MTKKLLALLCAVCLALLAAGCSKHDTSQSPQQDRAYVGVSLAGKPEDTLSVQIRSQLEKLGFGATVQCADGDAKTQAAQLRVLLAEGVDCLIVQAVDSLALLEIGTTAKEKNIPIIACDTLLMDTDWVWGYVSYDYEALGVQMAEKVLQAADVHMENTKAKTIEFFMGAPEDNNAYLLHKGALSVLQPYLSAGKLHCRSGRTTFEDTYTDSTCAGGNSACADRLQSSYRKTKLDICFAGTDEIATGCRQALDAAGYTRGNWPVLIGQGGANAQTVKDGYQLATYEKNHSLMASTCAKAAAAALAGASFPGDGSVHDNHVIQIPGKRLPVVEVSVTPSF